MPPVVILDLDGTVINTEQLIDEVVSAVVLERCDASVTALRVHDALERARGRRPLEASRLVVEELNLECTPEALLATTAPLLNARWSEVRLMPGARRLMEHLERHGVTFGLATSTPADFLAAKMAAHDYVMKKMRCVITGCMVTNGKPSPEIFERARVGLGGPDARECICIEDTPVGCEAATNAGMRTIAVPSIRDRTCFESCSETVLHSLYDLELSRFGLPEFEDWLSVADGSTDKVLPVEPVIMRGPVVKGFGRGSKMLGIPTANLDVVPLKSQVDSLAPGIYLGFASIRGETHEMVMSIGWNPYFDNSKKTIEPWLLHEFPYYLYDEELAVVVSGYIRPEADFTTLEALVERIHRDAEVARTMLKNTPFKETRELLVA